MDLKKISEYIDVERLKGLTVKVNLAQGELLQLAVFGNGGAWIGGDNMVHQEKIITIDNYLTMNTNEENEPIPFHEAIGLYDLGGRAIVDRILKQNNCDSISCDNCPLDGNEQKNRCRNYDTSVYYAQLYKIAFPELWGNKPESKEEKEQFPEFPKITPEWLEKWWGFIEAYENGYENECAMPGEWCYTGKCPFVNTKNCFNNGEYRNIFMQQAKQKLAEMDANNPPQFNKDVARELFLRYLKANYVTQDKKGRVDLFEKKPYIEKDNPITFCEHDGCIVSGGVGFYSEHPDGWENSLYCRDDVMCSRFASGGIVGHYHNWIGEPIHQKHTRKQSLKSRLNNVRFE